MQTTLRAAGGLLWRDTDDGVHVALAHRPKHQDWSLPKTELTPGEHPLAGACRAVTSKTGLTAVVGTRLPSTAYHVLTSRGSADKTVDYWSMRLAHDNASTPGVTEASDPSFTPTDEVDELRWTPLDEAADVLSYRRDREVISAFAATPRPLSMVLLARHAPASEADRWEGPDVTRPLDAAGAAAAIRLSDLLAHFAPVRILSATPRRCVQTVTPLAAQPGLEVESDIVFDIDSHLRSPEVAAARVRELANSARHGAVVVCCQDGVIPDTVAILADSDGLHLPITAVSTAAAWGLFLANGRLVAADYLSS